MFIFEKIYVKCAPTTLLPVPINIRHESLFISKTMSTVYYLVVLESAETNVEVQDLLLAFESYSME